MSDPVSPMPGTDTPSAEIERVAMEQHHVEVMPLIQTGEIEGYWRVANALAKSRMFKDTHQAEQCFAKILIGRDLGISPTQAMMSIDLVKGNVQLRGVLLLSFVRKHPDYDYKVIESTSEKAVLRFLGHPQSEPEDGFVKSAGMYWEVLGDSEFSVADARRAGLVKSGGAWEAHPKNMCIWRAGSNGVKFFAPELLGGMPVYVEGELDHLRTPSAAPVAVAAEPAPALPGEITDRLSRAAALDPARWRVAKVTARIPLPDDAGYATAIAALVDELDAWLAEHEPVDAEVVTATPADPDDAEAAEPDPEAGEADMGGDLDLDGVLQERWNTDPEWRATVDRLLNQHADLSMALDDEPGSDQLQADLDAAEDALDALGVPLTWHPSSNEG